MSTSIAAVLAQRPKSPSGAASSSSSTSDILDLRADEGWEDVQPEEEEDVQAVCLLNDGTFRTVHALLAHCSETHGYDLLAVRRDLGGYVLITGIIKSRLTDVIRARLLRDDQTGQLPAVGSPSGSVAAETIVTGGV